MLQNSVASAKNLTRISVRDSDLFIFVDVFDLGIVIQWDKKTRIYVKAEPKWKGKVMFKNFFYLLKKKKKSNLIKNSFLA